MTRRLLVLCALACACASAQITSIPAAAGGGGGGGSGPLFTYTHFWGLDQNTVAGWGLTCPPGGGGCPTFMPYEEANAGDVTATTLWTAISYLSFAKNGANNTAQAVDMHFRIPATWATSTKTGTFDVQFRTAGTTGAVLFQLQGKCLTPPAVPGTASSPVSFTAKTVAGTTLQWVAVAQLTLTASDVLAGCAANDTLLVRFWRQGNSGSDTHAGAAEVASILVGLAQ